MKAWYPIFVFFPIFLMCSCFPDEHMQGSSREAPAAYIPPPENVPPAPAPDSGEWIGPKSYKTKTSSNL